MASEKLICFPRENSMIVYSDYETKKLGIYLLPKYSIISNNKRIKIEDEMVSMDSK